MYPKTKNDDEKKADDCNFFVKNLNKKCFLSVNIL